MKPFRKNVALAVDGGGIRGVVVARALSILEAHLGLPVGGIFRLTAGTSTGSIIAAGTAAGLTAHRMSELYQQLGAKIFRKNIWTLLWPLTGHRYPAGPLEKALHSQIGDLKMGDLWSTSTATDVVITTFDLVSNHTCFIKPWKADYRDWPVVKAILASSCVPTYFPVVEGRYVDGGIGSYANPCYLAAYEIQYCLDWDPAETTLISLGTGRGPHVFRPQAANHLWAWEWIEPVLDGFMQSAADQQVHLVNTFFPQLDFRRFQVDLRQPIGMDDTSQMPSLLAYGEELGRKIIYDETDPVQKIKAKTAPPLPKVYALPPWSDFPSRLESPHLKINTP